MMSKLKIIIFGLIVCIAAAVVLMFTVFADKPKEAIIGQDGIARLNFLVGDTLKGHSVINAEGSSLDISKLPGKLKLVIFGWDLCGDCTKEYDNYKLLFEFYNSDKLTISFVWRDDVPYEVTDSWGVPRESNYSDGGDIRFTNWVPTYMITDNQGKILFKDIEMKPLVKYLRDYCVPNNDAVEAFLGDRLLFFGLDDCVGCINIYNEISTNKYSIKIDDLFIIKDADTHNQNVSLLDPHFIVSSVFGVNSYPKFVYKKNGHIAIESNIWNTDYAKE